jgi:hypothetical protein
MVDDSMGLHSTNTISTLSGWASSVVPPPRSTKCGLANFGTSPPTDGTDRQALNLRVRGSDTSINQLSESLSVSLDSVTALPSSLETP